MFDLKYFVQAKIILRTLSLDFFSRRVGSPANQKATSYFKSVAERLGLRTESQRFNCSNHRSGKIHLSCGGKEFAAFISPHSIGCDINAELAVADNLETLKSGDFRDKILLLTDELTKEQLMPKNFPFYNPESHQEIYHLLETGQPAAILSATGKNPELAGAQYPFPLIEDGDFDIPNAFMTDIEGEELSKYAGSSLKLKMDAERIPSQAENVIVHLGDSENERVVICAHIDSKYGTPGAVDNGGGIVVLLLLAEMLKEHSSPAVELLAMNGEDHYSAGGEKVFLHRNQGKMDTIKLVINVDGVGLKGHPNEVSFYDCPAEVETLALDLLKEYPNIKQGEPWYQSDHMVFAMQQVPAIAITTAAFIQMEREIAHTEKDVPELVDIELLIETAEYIRAILKRLEKTIHAE
jgi:aminopeptidase YwaD